MRCVKMESETLCEVPLLVATDARVPNMLSLCIATSTDPTTAPSLPPLHLPACHIHIVSRYTGEL